MSIFGLFKPDIQKLKIDRNVKGLVRALKDRDGDVREAAAAALGEIMDTRAVEPLISALKDSHWRVRQAAVKALGTIGDARAVWPLIAVLKHGDHKKIAIEALSKIGMPAIEPLTAVLKDGYNSAYVRGEAVEALSKIGAPAIEPLIAALNNHHWDMSIRESAAEGLGMIGDARAVESLISALKDSHWRVRLAAAGSLSKLGWKPVNDSQRAVYAVAGGKWEEAAQFGAEAIKPLTAILNDSDVRWAAAEALSKIGVPAIEPLITLLGNGDNNLSAAAAETLGKIRDARAVEPLIAALEDQDRNVRWAAAEALSKIGVPAIEPLAAALSNHWNVGVRERVAEVLSKIGASAVEPLTAALKDHDRDVRKAAAVALSKLGWKPVNDSQCAAYAVARREWDEAVQFGAEAVEPLTTVLDDFYDRREAAEALSKIGTPAVEPLIAILSDGNSNVRRAAGEVLEKLSWHPTDTKQRVWFAIARHQWQDAVAMGVEAIEILATALNDRDEDVGVGAAQALGQLGVSAIEPLANYLSRINTEWQRVGSLGLAAADSRIRYQCFEELTHLRAVKELTELTSNRYIAAMAVECLEKILVDHSSQLSDDELLYVQNLGKIVHIVRMYQSEADKTGSPFDKPVSTLQLLGYVEKEQQKRWE